MKKFNQILVLLSISNIVQSANEVDKKSAEGYMVKGISEVDGNCFVLMEKEENSTKVYETKTLLIPASSQITKDTTKPMNELGAEGYKVAGMTDSDRFLVVIMEREKVADKNTDKATQK